MKKHIKIIAVALVVVIIATIAIVLGTKKKPTGILEVNFTIAGYGDAYVQEICDAFTAETGIAVEYTTDDNATNSAISRITSVKKNTTDVFFTMVPAFQIIDNCKNKNGYDNLVMDLSELYQMEVPGKGKTLYELVRKDLYNANLTFDMDGEAGKSYTIPWTTSTEGLIANTKVLKKYGITQMPRTTDEWEEILDIIKSGKTLDGNIVAPTDRVSGAITCANNSAYWEFVWPVWWAQYEGIDSIDAYYSAKPDNAGDVYIPDWQALDREGKLVAIEELYRFLFKGNGYMDTESENRDHLQSQVDFFDGKAAFIPSGAWIETETAKDFYAEGADIEFEMIKTPVTSRLAVKLDITEEELRAGIDYADGVITTAPTFAGKNEQESADIMQAIIKARGIVSSGLTSQNKIIIPAYSTELEQAYQFVLFYASDKCQEILVKHGIMSAFNYKAESLDTLSDFNKSMFAILEMSNTELLMPGNRYPMAYKAGLDYSAHRLISSPLKCFENLIYNGTKTAQQIYQEDIDYYKSKWDQMLLNAGYGK